MARYQLTYVMNDGSEKHDFTEETSDSIERIKAHFAALVAKANAGNRLFASLVNVKTVIVEPWA